MKLKQMKRTVSGTGVTYRSPAVDLKGDSHYEVTVDGPKGAVEKALGEADFVFEIDPDGTQKDTDRRVTTLLEPYRREMERLAMDPARLTPRVPAKEPAVKLARVITVSIRPTAKHGTFWYFDTVLPIPLPRAIPLQIVLPPCSMGGAASFPIAGNPNVRIRFNSPFAPNASLSAFGGLAIDVASFVRPPWALVLPFYQFPAAVPSAARLTCWGLSLLPF